MFRIKFNHGGNVTLNSLLFTNNDSVREDQEETEEVDVVKSVTSSGSKRSSVIVETSKKDGFHQLIIHGE